MTKRKCSLREIYTNAEKLQEVVKANLGEKVRDLYGDFGYIAGFDYINNSIVLGYSHSNGWQLDTKTPVTILKEYKSYKYSTTSALKSLRHKGKC